MAVPPFCWLVLLPQAWVDARLNSEGRVQLAAASDSSITAGLAGLLVTALQGMTPQQVLDLDAASFLPALGLGPGVLTPSRSHGLANLLEAIRRRTRQLVSQLPHFPSLLVRAGSVQAQGVFAEVQAQYLTPDQAQVNQLAELLRSKAIGVVAHFYMDPQVRGQRHTPTLHCTLLTLSSMVYAVLHSVLQCWVRVQSTKQHSGPHVMCWVISLALGREKQPACRNGITHQCRTAWLPAFICMVTCPWPGIA